MNGLDRMKKRIAYYGDQNDSSQWTRMRQDKLRSMKKALYYSYQAAVVQKYIPTEKDNQSSPFFRCLINKEKQHVDYQDKEISIPFQECSVSVEPKVKDNNDLLETGFHTGTTFVWRHGNRQEWVPDSHWIVYMQYSEQTAYFRGEIRKADQEIEIIPIEKDGSEGDPLIYYGWTSGPDEKSILWNVKQDTVWNDLNYTKLIYITKDETTLAFFKRFDRVNINGKPWEVQAFNENYGTTSNKPDTGIIRVAVKETYTSTKQQIRNKEKAAAEEKEPTIIGSSTLSPYDKNVKYRIKNSSGGAWSVSTPSGAPADDIVSYTIDDNNNLYISVITNKAYEPGIDICYGEVKKHINIKTLGGR